MKRFPAVVPLLLGLALAAASLEASDRMRRIREALEAGRLQAARELCLQGLGERPDSIRYLRTLSGIALKRSDCGEALSAIQRARKRAPHSPDVLFEYALVAMECGETPDGVHTLRLLHLMQPEEPRVLYQLGKALLQTPEFPESLSYIERYCESRPKDARGLRTLAYAQLLTGRLEEASQTLSRSREIEPSHWEADYYEAALALERTDYQRAERLFRKTLSAIPQHGPSRLGLGKVLLRTERYRPALEQLNQATRLLPARAEVHFQLSRAYARLGQPEKAREQIALFRQKKKQAEEERQ